jgi:hypothetical protein
MRPQAIGHQKKQNRIVPPSPSRSSLHCFQHAADFIPRDGTWHIVESIYLWSSHGSAEIPTRDFLAVTEPQQNSQMAAETEARTGSHLRPVLHNESRQNCRGQLAERSDASSAEVLSKLTQVATVVANGAFGESTFTAQILSNPGTADSNGNGRRRRLRITGSLQANCSICRTPHSASIVCLRTATAVFVFAPCCSTHCDTNSFMSLARSNVSAPLLLCELGEVKEQWQPAIHNEARVTVCLQPFEVALDLRSQPTTTDSVDG